MMSPRCLCFAIIATLAFLAAGVDASPFGVAPTASTPNTFSRGPILTELRGGGDNDADADSTDGGAPAFRPYLPYALAIRDSIMIAHSFHGHPSFGPAGGMHGATYTVDVEFASKELHPECNWVIDIGLASDMVADVLKKFNYKNLDEVYGEGVMTTTEFMCRAIFDGIVEKLKEKYAEDSDENGFKGWIKVSLWESHKAWASFEGPSS